MKHIICLFALVFPFVTNAQSQPAGSSWVTFSKSYYTIDYPSTWRVDTSKTLGADVFLFSPKDLEEDKFSENVNVMIQDLTGMNIDLDKFVEITKNQIKTFVTNGNLLESKRMSKGGMEFHQIVYSASQGIFQLKTRQYYFIVDQKAYLVTLVTEADKYENYLSIGEKIMDSFKLIR
jgi:hypothetical protein